MKTKEYKSPLRDENGKFLFTKELKENWLKALRSGDYIQHGDKLRSNNNHKRMCCLGVLADIHPDIQIDKKGENCIVNNINEQYEPFNNMNLHAGCSVGLTDINDKSYVKGKRDYSEVIPLIETLTTID